MNNRKNLLQSESAVATSRCPLCNDARGQSTKSSKLILEFQHDHEVIRNEADQLRAATKQDVKDSPRALLRFNRLERLLTQHCTKEERYLFPPLRSYLDSNVCEEISNEHAAIRTLLHQVIHQGKFAPANSVLKLDQLLSAHFSIEENVLFWYLNIRMAAEGSTAEDVHLT